VGRLFLKIRNPEGSWLLFLFGRFFRGRGRLCWRRSRRSPRHSLFKTTHSFAESTHQLRNFATAEKNQDYDRHNQQMHRAVPHTCHLSNQTAILWNPFTGTLWSCPSKYNTLVTRTAGDAFPVKILQERYCVLSSYAGQVLENWDGNAISPGLFVR
jgi:hypothetical protein